MKNEPGEVFFSKSSKEYRKLKSTFWDENEVLLEAELRASKFYSQGISRDKCKICKEILLDVFDLTQHGTSFKICRRCHHLNGAHEEDSRLMSYLYDNFSTEGEDYSKNYSGDQFIERASNFYRPKVDFLKKFIDPENELLLDVGCGAGHFVFEAIKSGFIARGIDLGMKSVAFGNSEISNVLGTSPLKYVSEGGFLSEISNFEGKIVSAIGVLEHLQDPSSFAEAFKKSGAQYLYFSIPLFSLSAFLENVFKRTAPRLLTISGGHTHLFSRESYKLLVSMFDSEIISEWRFGSDMLDFARSVELELKLNGTSNFAIDFFRNGLSEAIDPLQEVLDRSDNYSEIHALVKKF